MGSDAKGAERKQKDGAKKKAKEPELVSQISRASACTTNNGGLRVIYNVLRYSKYYPSLNATECH